MLPIVSANTFLDWAYWGGGLLLRNSPLTVSDNIVTNNRAGIVGSVNGAGGGIALINSNATLVNNTISNNSAASEGGGVDSQGSSPVLKNDIITGNYSGGDGGGLWSFTDNASVGPTLINCLVAGNTGQRDSGGGITIWVSALTLLNTTVTANTPGGVRDHDPSRDAVVITNSILSGNLSGADLIGRTGAGLTASNAAVSYSIVGTGSYTPGTGVTSANPLFVDPGAGNFRLQFASPAIDSGSSAAVPSGVATDLDGGPRVTGTAVDMGAYESQTPAGPTQFDISGLLNADVVINSSGTSGNGIDGSNYAYMTASRAAARGFGSGAGLPDNGLIPADGNHPPVQLYSVNTSEGYNVRLSFAGETYTIAVPNRPYTQVQLFGVATEGSPTMTFTLRYSDATTDTRVMSVPDWTSGGPGANQFILVGGLARESNGDHQVQSVNAKIVGLNLNPNSAKTLVSIDVSKPTGNQRFVLFAAGGQ